MARACAGHADRDPGRHDLLAGHAAPVAGRWSGRASTRWPSASTPPPVDCGIFLVAPVRRPAGSLPGRRRLLSAGPGGLTAACMLVFPLWVDPWFWFRLRLLFGCAGSLMFVLSEAAVNALTPGRDPRPRARRLCHPVQPRLRQRSAGARACRQRGLDAVRAGQRHVPRGPAAGGPAATGRSNASRLTADHRHRFVDTWRVAPLALGGVFVYALLEAIAVRAACRSTRSIGAWAKRMAAACSASGSPATSCPNIRWAGSPTAGSRRAVMAGCAALACRGPAPRAVRAVGVPASSGRLLVRSVG